MVFNLFRDYLRIVIYYVYTTSINQRRSQKSKIGTEYKEYNLIKKIII